MSISQASVDALFESTAASENSGAAAGGAPAAMSTTAVKPSIRKPEMRRILGLSVPVSVVLAQRHMPIEAILEMTAGTIVEFDVPFDSELTLEVANRPIGRGQAVKTGENFGLRIAEIGTVHERIGAMGGR